MGLVSETSFNKFNSLEPVKCTHCGLGCDSQIIEKGDETFCCHGCEFVYALIQDRGFEDYYQIKQNSSFVRPARRAQGKRGNYTYLDHSDFRDKYLVLSSGAGSFEFYLEGVHCTACLWLVEKAVLSLPGVTHASLDLEKSVLSLKVENDVSLSKIASELNLLGYTPHPLLEEDQVKKLRQREEQKELIRLGVVFTLAGNLMLLSISVYAGLQGPLRDSFNLISLFLFLPVAFYGAIPFYQKAWASFKQRQLHIDQPIALSVTLGFAFSIYQTFAGHGDVYFDSLAILVFLLLGSRTFLRKLQQKFLHLSNLHYFFNQGSAKKFNFQAKNYEDVPASSLKPGDKIFVEAGEVLPVDGMVIGGFSHLQVSLLTGEPKPMRVKASDKVYGGCENVTSALEIEVTEVGEESRLGKILKDLQKGEGEKSHFSHLADRLSKFFLLTIFSLSLVAFIYASLNYGFEEGMRRALSLIIVACPCALGLATPFALTLFLKRTAEKGILLRGEYLLEKILAAKNIFFDKTGTLTEGKFKVLSCEEKKPLKEFAPLIFALERKSRHPLAFALKEYLRKSGFQDDSLELEVLEELGKGVSCFYQGKAYSIGKASEEKEGVTSIALKENDSEILVFHFSDQLRPEGQAVISELKQRELEPHLISGDHLGSCLKVAEAAGIDKNNIFSNISPEGKLEVLKSHPNSLMVGDGANDALAMGRAYVGIAMEGSASLCLKASDIFLARPDLNSLVHLITEAYETSKILKRNIRFALGYNIFGITLAMLGYISPLTAAILMPISSFTIFISTLWGTPTTRRKL